MVLADLWLCSKSTTGRYIIVLLFARIRARRCGCPSNCGRRRSTLPATMTFRRSGSAGKLS